jgi:membrane-associated phospholipid phosphatase
MPLFRFEGVAAAYFVLLAVGGTIAPVPIRDRARAIAACGLVVFVIAAAVRTLPHNVRAWLPLLYLVLGYWLPAMLTRTPGETRFEAWLRRSDVAWRSFIPAPGPLAAGVLELAYLACYVVVPAAFLTAWQYGTIDQVDRYWTAVLLAGFSCYGSLPWLVSRPPRMFADAQESRGPRAVGAFNVSVLRRVSHQLNTFPSGHVAVAIAVASTILPISRPAGAAFGVVAAGIAVGAAVGRYHYGVDVVAGALVGLAAALISW